MWGYMRPTCGDGAAGVPARRTGETPVPPQTELVFLSANLPVPHHLVL